MYLSRVFYRFSDFLLEKGRIKLNPQQLWIFEKLYNRVSGYCCLSVSIALA